MATSRFFVSDLHINTTEQDLRYVFQEYGKINNIELKTKQNLVDPDDIKIIAFVTLNIGAEDAQYYLKELNWKKIHGQTIKVTWAKESFLERLKREREEEQRITEGYDASSATEQTFEQQSDLLKAPLENKKKIFDIDDELGDDEVAPELMISKKRAASSMYNGKIVIQQSFNVEPIHVIETKHNKKKKTMDSQASSAEQKRKDSLNKMKNQYDQKKIAIQKALQGVNIKPVNKIKFSDAESESEDDKSLKKQKTDLFGTDDEEEGEDNGFNAAVMGGKGEKLARMQAKQSLDPRFRIDAKFVDEDGDECENAVVDDVDNERDWQMNILEQVVGRKLDTAKGGNRTKQNKKMLRYDPAKDDHQQFERSKEEYSQLKQPKPKDSKAKNDSQPADVSKEVFYIVGDSLQQSLRTRGEGFSLLNMFGRDEQLEQRGEQLKQLGKEKILVNSNKSLSANPFNYDSSSDSESEEITPDQENVAETQKIDLSKQQKIGKLKKKQKLTTESFFIPKNDVRLKEGAKFFIYKKSEDVTNENYQEVRNRLKLLIKTKITKTKKNLTNAGYKGKRKA